MFKAKRKLISLLTACMALVLMLVMGVATMSIQPKVASAAEDQTVTLSIVSTKGTLSNSNKTISWTSGVATFTNNQGSSTNAIRTSDSDHYRVYANSNGSVSVADNAVLVKVVITCTSSSYATACKNSFGSIASASSSTVTITPAEGATSVEFAKATAQWRLNKIVVTYQEAISEPECEHEYVWNQENGKHIEVCSLCGENKEGAVWEACDGELSYTKIQTGANGKHKKVGSCSTCGTDLSTDEEACVFEESVEGTTKTYACECGNSYTEEVVVYTVTLSSADGESENQVVDGGKLNLPTATAPEDYVFVGWAETSIAGTTATAPATFTGDYTVTGDKTLYAVYKNDAKPSGWSAVTSANDLATGDIVTIVSSSKNVAIGKASGTYFTSVNISISGNTFADNADVLKLTLTINSDGTYSFHTGSAYLSWNSGNALNTNTTIAKSSSWNVTINSTSTKILNANDSTRNLQYNAKDPRFACYTSAQTAVSLFEYSEGEPISYRTSFCDHSGETVETTENPTCTVKGSVTVACGNCGEVLEVREIPATDHANRTTTTVDATCTEDGSKTVTCDDCGETLSVTAIPMTGHSLDEGVVTKQPDVGVEGERTYTCQNEGCNHTETESIPALDAETFVVSYSVPKGIDAVESSEAVVSGETVILPTANAKEGFVFVGWVLTKTVETEVCPEVFSAETEYTVTGDITLYALYSYTTGSGNYVKVTENLADWSGEYLIVYESGENAYIFNAADAADGYVSATTNGASIVNNEASSAEAVTLAKMDGGYSILTKNGYIYGTSNNNKLNFNATTAQLNTIAIKDNGTVNIINNGTYLRFNAASNQMRFRYYKTDSQEGICLYKLDGATRYATSLPSIGSASVTIGEDVALNYYVTMSEGLEATMNFKMDGETYDRQLIEDGARYKVSLELPPQYMATEISVELIVNGVVVETMTYSIKQYAQSMLNDAGNSDKLKRLVSDMLYYGAAAQVYRGYNVENLATADVTNLVGTPSTVTPEEADNVRMLTSHVADKKASFKSVSVWFDDVNKIYVKVNTQNANGAAVTLKILKGETVEKEVVVTSETVFTEGILATDFDETYTFELSVDGELTQTLTYSVNAYAYKMQTHADMGELALALYRYGKSAEAYKG